MLFAKRKHVFCDITSIMLQKGSPAAEVNLLPCDHEVMVLNIGNNLL
jgi:hypothetical protein